MSFRAFCRLGHLVVQGIWSLRAFGIRAFGRLGHLVLGHLVLGHLVLGHLVVRHREVDRPFHAPACTKPLPNALASTRLPQCQTIAWHPQHKILKPTSGKTNSARNQIPRPGDTECFGRPAVPKYHAVSPRSSRCIVMYHIGRKYEIQAFEKL